MITMVSIMYYKNNRRYDDYCEFGNNRIKMEKII